MIVAFVRWVLYKLFQRQVIEHTYRSRTIGFQGWLELPHFGALAFRQDDGSLQFHW